MHIAIGGTLMLLGLIVVWVFAAAVSNDPGCLNIDTPWRCGGRPRC